LMSHGQATRSTLTFSRVIHFILLPPFTAADLALAGHRLRLFSISNILPEEESREGSVDALDGPHPTDGSPKTINHGIIQKKKCPPPTQVGLIICTELCFTVSEYVSINEWTCAL
jgi:hypothetical protein